MTEIKKSVLSDGIVLYENVLPNPNEIIQKVESLVDQGFLQWYTAKVDSGNGDEKNTSIRDTHSLAIPYDFDYNNSEIKYLQNVLSESFQKFINDYLKDSSLEFSKYQNYEILKYGAGQKFEEHVDDSSAYPRKLTLICYPNNDYTGGEIEFPQHNLQVKPDANQMIIFPSDAKYAHRVHPVIGGTRYAVVQWMS